MQTRYPWLTDRYLVDPYELSLSRYYQLLRVSAIKHREEREERRDETAWHAWQTTAHNFGSAKKKAPSFAEWRKMVGLGDTKIAKSSAPPPLDEAGKKALMEKVMGFVANDHIRTQTRKGIKGHKRNMATPRGVGSS